jgi:thioredoxin-related protein
MSLDTLLNRFAVGVTMAGLVVVTATGVALAMPGARETLGLARPAYARGQHVDLPRDMYAGASYTLVVFGRSTCSASGRSAEFLRRLVATVEALPHVRVRMVTAAPVAAQELEFARSLGLDEAQVTAVDLSTLRVRQVPSLVLVDGSGQIHYAREGAVPVRQQEDVLQIVAALTR